MEMTSGQLFFEKQLAYIKARDVDGLIDNHYTEDAVLLSLGSHPIAVKGRQALKEHFRKYFNSRGSKGLRCFCFTERQDFSSLCWHT